MAATRRFHSALMHGLWVELELSGLDLRQVEHLVDEAKEVCPSAVHALQRLLRLFRAEARRVAEHHLGQPDDGIERRAQLVAHAGDELRLVLARLCQLAARVLDFLEQPHVLDGDHGLIGKGGDQLDLLVRERPHDRTRQHEHADRVSFAQQRNREHGARRPVLSWASLHVYSGSAKTSGTWTVLPSCKARPTTVPRPALITTLLK